MEQANQAFLTESTASDKEISLYTLLGEWSDEDKWYFEMCTGLSLTAALTCTVKYARDRLKKLKMSNKDIEKRIRGLKTFLELFQKEIIECPAVYWRIYALCQIAMELLATEELSQLKDDYENDEDIKKNNDAINAKLRIRSRFYPIIDHYMGEIGENITYINSEENRTVCKERLYQDLQTDILNSYLWFYVFNASALGSEKASEELHITKNDKEDVPTSDGEEQPEKYVKTIEICIKKSLEKERETLDEVQKFGEFPWEYCPTWIYQIDDFRSIDGLSKDQKRDFEEIHSALYPDGYEIPAFLSLDLKNQKNKFPLKKGIITDKNPPEL